MIDNRNIQAAVISRLKANTDLTTALGGDTEIREQQWQGRDFAYPATRVAVATQTPLLDMGPCEWSRVTFSVLCMSEKPSSAEADQIAALVNAALHNKSFAGTGFKFHRIKSQGLNSAIRMNERVWRSEAFFTSDLYTT